MVLDRQNGWLLQQAVTGEAEEEQISCVTDGQDYRLFSVLDNLESADDIEVQYELRVESKSGTHTPVLMFSNCSCLISNTRLLSLGQTF